ncbi:Transposase OS=Eoetvoesiella caeni OX=645616 GN=DFR37_10888 PE=4 SV=1 [Eoetvoesiella caeni]
MLNRAKLPDNIDDLKALLSAQLDETQALREAHRTLKEEHQVLRVERDLLRQEKQFDKQEIQRLVLLLFKLKRQVFGQKSEKLLRQIDQLELELEELHINQGERAQKAESITPTARPAPARRPMPEHLPRDIQEHLPQAPACPDCGGAWQRLGEDLSEVLEYIPHRACASCAMCAHA